MQNVPFEYYLLFFHLRLPNIIPSNLSTTIS